MTDVTDTTNAPTARKHLNGAETVKLGNLILAHCQVVADGCAYEGDWTDAKIAEEFGCTANNVAGLRKQMLGPLVDPPPAPATDPRVGHLIERLDSLEERLLSLEVLK